MFIENFFNYGSCLKLVKYLNIQKNTTIPEFSWIPRLLLHYFH